MEEKVLKKSFLGGFKKSDVLDCIETLQKENEYLRRSVEELSAVRIENGNLKERIDELTAENSSLHSEIDSFGARKSVTDEKSENLVRDAVKYSDSLVDEAKTRAGIAVKKAGEAVGNAIGNIEGMSEKVSSVKEDADAALSSVISCIDDLLDKLRNSASGLNDGE